MTDHHPPATDEARADLAILAGELLAPLLPPLHALAEALHTPTPVELQGCDHFAVVTTTVGTSPTWVLAADLQRFRVTIYNIGSTDIYIGPDVSNMAGATRPGLWVKPGTSVGIDTRAAIAAVSPAGATEIQLVTEHRLAKS